MSNTYADILRRHAKQMTPIATDVEPVLRKLPNIRAVLFDVYGTLLISGSGEVGTAGQAACESALTGALEATGIIVSAPPAQGIECFYDAIRASHADSRAAEHRAGMDRGGVAQPPRRGAGPVGGADQRIREAGQRITLTSTPISSFAQA